MNRSGDFYVLDYMRKILLTVLVICSTFFFVNAQQVQNSDTVMVLPFENTSGKLEFNWVGESFADSLSGLLKIPGLSVVTNEERKIIQQRLRVPLTTLPSLATSLKLARESRATLLISGKYNIAPAQGDVGASISVTAKIIRVNEGRFLSEELSDGRKITRDINLSDALSNLQTVQGQLAYQILYQRDKSSLAFSQNQFIEAAGKIPPRAFEAYIKGLLSVNDRQARENFFKNAMKLYGEAKSGETYANVALELGHFYLSQKQYQAAIDYFSRIPENNSHYPESAFYTGLIHWQQNNFEQALAVLRPLADDLQLTSVYNMLGAIAVQAAREEKRNKQKSAALLNDGLAFLKKASESAPDDVQSRFNYGLALFTNGNFAEAAENLRPVLAMKPTDGEAYFILAKTLERLGDASATDFDNQARRFLNNYAKYETDWTRTKNFEIPLRVEQPERKDFVSIVLIKRQNAPMQTAVNEVENLLNQARSFYKAGRDDDAMQVLRRILASEPASAESYFLLGSIHLRRGDQEQAVSSLKTALFWDNRLVEAYIALSKIFLEKKDCLAAQNYLKSALEFDANNQDALALQRQVERCVK